jgi:hypothetical protein
MKPRLIGLHSSDPKAGGSYHPGLMIMPPHTPPHPRRPVAALLLGVAVLLGVGGCARTRVETSLATKVEAGDVNAEMDFWDALGARPVVCNDEGLHGLILFADRSDTTDSYAQRLEVARERGWVGKKWNEAADLAVRRGRLRAVVYCGSRGRHDVPPWPGPRPLCEPGAQHRGSWAGARSQQALSARVHGGIEQRCRTTCAKAGPNFRRRRRPPMPEPGHIPAPREKYPALSPPGAPRRRAECLSRRR